MDFSQRDCCEVGMLEMYTFLKAHNKYFNSSYSFDLAQLELLSGNTSSL